MSSLLSIARWTRFDVALISSKQLFLYRQQQNDTKLSLNLLAIWGLAVWPLHVVPAVWVLSRYSDFLIQSKEIHVKWLLPRMNSWAVSRTWARQSKTFRSQDLSKRNRKNDLTHCLGLTGWQQLGETRKSHQCDSPAPPSQIQKKIEGSYLPPWPKEFWKDNGEKDWQNDLEELAGFLQNKMLAMDRWKDGYSCKRMYVASQDTKKHLIKFVSLSHLCKRAKEQTSGGSCLGWNNNCSL